MLNGFDYKTYEIEQLYYQGMRLERKLKPEVDKIIDSIE
jgi:hypothetical protein